jgi:hypothetical protein
MADSEHNMQSLADLGQTWDLMAAGLESKDFTPSASGLMKVKLEKIIYDKKGGLATVSILGILEMIKHDLIVNSQGGGNE